MTNRLVQITFLGDLMCQMAQIRAIRHGKKSFDDVFASVCDQWRRSDCVIGNLETPATGRGRLAYEEMRFNAPISFLTAIKKAGVDFVTTANNHILDRGSSGIDATLRQLELQGIETTGAYRTQEESDRIFVREILGIRFAFVACTYDTNSGRKADMLDESDLWKVDYVHRPSAFRGTWAFAIKRALKELIPYALRRKLKAMRTGGTQKWSRPQPDSFPVGDYDRSEHQPFLDRVCDKIRCAKGQSDVVVVLPHIGGQYNVEPGPWQLKITDALINAGADLVVTNHAHTPLLAEVRQGVFCAHALGNFCFTPRVGFYNDQCQADYSIVLNCFFDRDTKKLVKKTFSITKSVVRDDGVSVVRPVSSADASDVRIICRRVTGRDEDFEVQEEYAL